MNFGYSCSESRAHLRSSKQRPATPPCAFSYRWPGISVRARQLLSAIYWQGLQVSAFLHFHPLLAILNSSVGGDLFAINDFGGS